MSRMTQNMTKSWKSSIRARLVTIFTLLIATISAFMFYYFPSHLEKQSIKAIAAKAQSIGEMTSFSISSAIYFDDAKTIEEGFGSARQNSDVVYILIADTTGHIVASFGSKAAVGANYLSSGDEGPISADGIMYRQVTPVIMNGKQIGKLFVGLSLVELKQDVSRSRTVIAAVSFLVFIVSVMMVIGISTLITRPLSQMAETATTIAQGDLTRRAPIMTIDEVGKLAAAFNHMIDNVEDRTRRLQSEIEQRHKAEKIIREQAALLDVTKDAIMVCDLQQRIVLWNKGAEHVYGWAREDVLGKEMTSVLPANDGVTNEATEQLFRTGEWQGEMQRLDKRGKTVIVESRWLLVRENGADPNSIFITETDVTGKKKLEVQFLRAQRMESVGTLAGGIAHDLNNVLGPVLLAAEILRGRLPDDESRKIIAMIEGSARRGADIIKQILSFARGVEGKKSALQLRHIVKEYEKMIRDMFPRSIEIRVKSADTPWLISGDVTQLYQLLMNLCVNARDAMPNGGLLKIELANVKLDEQYAAVHLDAKPGSYVVLSVTDSGTGMSPDVVDKIFEPFFTTKEFGRGTGLGLSTALGIVKGHGGFVNVYSEVGKGTKFATYLPALETSEVQEAVEQKAELPRGNGRLVLVVDDEADLRETQRNVLESYGYQVLTASDGTEGISIVADKGEKIHGVITDFMMPYLDGASTIRAMRKLNPRLRFIMASGLMNENKITSLMLDDSITFLQKPYSTEILLNALDKVLRN